jgi:hypothetical protein
MGDGTTARARAMTRATSIGSAARARIVTILVAIRFGSLSVVSSSDLDDPVDRMWRITKRLQLF